MATPNLLNPGNDPIVQEAIRKSLLGWTAGMPGQYGDLGQLTANIMTGLINAQMNVIDPQGRVPGMLNRDSRIPAPQVPYTFNDVVSRMGGDPSDPHTQAGSYLSPGIEDLIPGAKAVFAGLLSAGGVAKAANSLLGRKTPLPGSLEAQLGHIGDGAKGADNVYTGAAYRVEPGFEGGAPKGASAQDVIDEEMERKSIQHLDEFGIDEKTYDSLKDVPAENLVWVGRSKNELIEAYGPQNIGEHSYPGLFGGSPDDISDVSDAVRGGRVIYEDGDGVLVLKADNALVGGKPTWWDSPSENRLAKGMTKGEVVEDWLARNKVPQNDEGKYVFYHATPKTNKLSELKEGTLLETNPDDARFFAARDRDIRPEDTIVHEVTISPYDIGSTTTWASLGRPYKLPTKADNALVGGYSSQFPTKKAFKDYVTNTPSNDPNKRKVMYEVLDEQRAKVDAGALEKDGRPFGSPKGMTPDKREQMVQHYADRIERAEDAFPPGYFYEEGRQSVANAIPDPAGQRTFAHQIDQTSSQVGPAENVNYTARGRDQLATGQEVNTTIYPNKARGPFTQISEGQDIWTGYKRDRYGNLLTPEGARGDLPESALMAPNDRWEFRAAGFNTVPTDPSNVAYMDKFREDALNVANARRAGQGKPPLNLEQAQEMHWAVIRAESEGRPLVMNRGNDQIGGAMDRLEYSHTYEATPGLTAGQTVSPEGQQGLLNVFNQGGRDPLVESMGGDLQRPVVPARGYYEGQYNPGQTSRSLVSRTNTKGMDPSSQARVETTEAIRGLALGQDAVAGNVFTPISGAKNPKYNGVNIAGEVDDTALRNAVETAKEINPDMVVVNSPNGLRAWIPGNDSKAAQNQIQDFANEVKMSGKVTYGKVDSNYMELDWDGGGATQDVLDKIDNVDSPGLLGRADSQETREVMGAVAKKYDELQAAGLAVPNKKLKAVLKVWAKDGIDGVRDMVKKGLAPAAVLAVFGASQAGLLNEEPAGA